MINYKTYCNFGEIKSMYVIAKETKLGMKFHQVIGDYKTTTYRIEEAAKYETEEEAKQVLTTITSKGYRVYAQCLVEI